MLSATDQMGHNLELPERPKRIVSLVPSQTELLYHLGLDTEVVGITKFCVHPDHWFRSKTRIGGTKQINIENVKTLRPDLIIANKEENIKEQVMELQGLAPVWVSDVNNLDDALSMIRSVGEITGRDEEAKILIDKISKGFQLLSDLQTRPITAAYLIWKDPYMTVGGDTFISDMMERAGYKNAFAHLHRYPEVSIDDIRDSGCELVLLSSEPYPFQQQHIDALQSLLPSHKMVLVDGEMFSWYGSRLLHAPAYYEQLFKATR